MPFTTRLPRNILEWDKVTATRFGRGIKSTSSEHPVRDRMVMDAISYNRRVLAGYPKYDGSVFPHSSFLSL